MFRFNWVRGNYTEKKDGVTCFRILPKNLEKWMAQNKAKYAGNFVDGCLLDNFTLFTKRGCAAVYEHYTSPWTSDYYIEFERGTADTLWRNWYEFERKALEEE